MRVISKSRLRHFWETPGHDDSQSPLQGWYAHVSQKNVAWQNWSGVKAEFGSASLVGNCVVFNIGGNKYRLITRILYRSQKVFVLKIMTHEDYDKNDWAEECGCHAGPPKSGAANGKPSSKKTKDT